MITLRECIRMVMRPSRTLLIFLPLAGACEETHRRCIGSETKQEQLARESCWPFQQSIETTRIVIAPCVTQCDIVFSLRLQIADCRLHLQYIFGTESTADCRLQISEGGGGGRATLHTEYMIEITDLVQPAAKVAKCRLQNALQIASPQPRLQIADCGKANYRKLKRDCRLQIARWRSGEFWVVPDRFQISDCRALAREKMGRNLNLKADCRLQIAAAGRSAMRWA